MNINAAVFDFNGTLFFDFDENRDAWEITSKKYRGYGLGKDGFDKIAGMTDTACTKIICPDADDEKVIEIYTYKETVYKELCKKRGIDLAPYSRELLSRLKEDGIKLAIGSSAPKMNMEWYISDLHLEEFFEKEWIIYGREELPSKPAPDIYLLTLDIIGEEAKSAICFEDAANGITAAKNAGFSKVFAINCPCLDTSNTKKLAPLVDYKWCLDNYSSIIRLD